ncbi:hypothetical protein BOX15_Mlig004453g1, partial [Macrostomum lignano]
DYCLVEVSTAVSDAELRSLNLTPAFDQPEPTSAPSAAPVSLVNQDGSAAAASAGGAVHLRMPERWVLERLQPVCRPLVLSEVTGDTTAAAAAATDSPRWRSLRQVAAVCRLRRRFLKPQPLPVKAPPPPPLPQETTPQAAAEPEADKAKKKKKKQDKKRTHRISGEDEVATQVYRQVYS